MTMQDHDPLAGHPDLVALGAGPDLPPPPPKRRTLPWLLGVGVLVVVAAALLIWWLLSSTVPTSDYDAVVADLDSVEAEFEAAQIASGEQIAALSDEIDGLAATNDELRATNDDLDGQLAATNTRLSDLIDQRNELWTQVAGAASVADAIVYSALNVDPEYFAELQDLGLEAAPYDDLLAQLGHDEGIEAWLSSGRSWFRANAAIAATNDPALIDAWATWSEAPLGSNEEWVAWNAFNVRLLSLLLERTADVDGVASDVVVAARPDGG